MVDVCCFNQEKKYFIFMLMQDINCQLSFSAPGDSRWISLCCR